MIERERAARTKEQLDADYCSDVTREGGGRLICRNQQTVFIFQFPRTAILALCVAINLGSYCLAPLSLVAQNINDTASADSLLTAKEIADIQEMFKGRPKEAQYAIALLTKQRRRVRDLTLNPGELRKQLILLIEKMRAANAPGSMSAFRDVRGKLINELRWLENNRVGIPIDLGNEMAETLLEIYSKGPAHERVADSLPIEVAAKYGDSLKVKRHLIRLLDGNDDKRRAITVQALKWTQSLKDDNGIYSALHRSFSKNGGRDTVVLAAMARVDGARALPLLLQEIESTQDVGHFQKCTALLSGYGRFELLEHALRRIKDFQRVPPAHDANPMLGISPELLVRYVEAAEGTQLEVALDALTMTAVASAESYPVLLKKLTSGGRNTRKAVLGFFERGISSGSYDDGGTFDEIQRYADGEPDLSLKGRAQKIIDNLRGNSGRK